MMAPLLYRNFRVSRAGPVSLALLVALGLSLARPHPVEAQWKPDWNVKCTWLHSQILMGLLESLRLALDAKFGDQVPDDLADQLMQQVFCNDQPSLLIPRPAAFHRAEFRASSRWLEGFGFPDPIVKPAPHPDKYLAWIDEWRWTRKDPQTGDPVVEDGGVYDRDGDLRLSSTEYFRKRSTEPHELFHGVQNAATAADPSKMWNAPNAPKLWLWDGTADAVAYAWAKKPGSKSSPDIFARRWDRPLPWVQGSGRPPTAAYATASFWLDVGRQLRAKDWVEYLPHVLSTVAQTRGITTGIDQALEELFDRKGIEGEGGLYRAFPEFVRYRLADPDTLHVHFPAPRPVDLEVTSAKGVDEDPLDDHVQRLAAQSYVVKATVPQGTLAALTIELEAKEQRLDDHLHLIVDSLRFSRPATLTHPNRRRNKFATTVTGTGRDTTFFVRVANVAKDPTKNEDVPMKITFTLARSQASAVVSGSESGQLTGALFTYINPRADVQALTRAITPALIDRYAEHAGLDETTEPGRVSREMIRSAVDEAQAQQAQGAGGAGTGRCKAVITLYNDDENAVAKLMWDGDPPLLGQEKHLVRATYAHALHDVRYGTVKQQGQEIALIDDPQALTEWDTELKTVSLPALAALMQTRGRGEEMGETYDQGGFGILRVAESSGEKVEATFRFRVRNEERRAVNVEGGFTAIPGPIMSEFMRTGCENLPEPPEEDNGTITPTPAVYPPGVDEKPFWCMKSAWHMAACACGGYMLGRGILVGEVALTDCICDVLETVFPEEDYTVFLCGRPPPPPCEGEECPVDCVAGERTMSVLEDWHVVVVDGKPVERRTVRYEREVLVEPRNGGKPCPPGETLTEERPIPGDPVDCRAGPVIETVLKDWHVVTTENGERVERRTVRREREILEPARNGGRPCPPPEIVEEERPIPDDPVDCVVGERTVTVLEDWHPVVIDGQRVEQRTVRYDWEILVEPRNGGEPCPSGETATETRPVSQRGPDPDPGAPVGGDPEREPDPDRDGERDPAAEAPEGGRAREVEGTDLVLDFLEEGGADLRSDPQTVAGRGSLAGVSVTSSVYALGLALGEAEVAGCGFSESVRMGLQMLASGRLLQGELHLNADAGRVEVELEFDQGVILVRGDGPGTVDLGPGGASGVRGDVSGGDLELRLDQGSFTCDGLVDFSFRLTEAP